MFFKTPIQIIGYPDITLGTKGNTLEKINVLHWAPSAFARATADQPSPPAWSQPIRPTALAAGLVLR